MEICDCARRCILRSIKRALELTDIILACAKNDRSAQEKLYRLFFQSMYQVCLRQTDGDSNRAMEIVNMGFLKAFQKIDQFRFEGSFEGWLRRIMQNAIADYFRQANHKNVVEIEPEKHIAYENPSSPVEYEELLLHLDKLPPVTQVVFKMFAIDGYTHAEIAKRQNMSESTSKWHVVNAREKLKKWIHN